MFDGIKIKDVSVNVETLLKNGRLTFETRFDEQTGEILSPIRIAKDQGLIFRLIPRQISQGYRLEMEGSIHKFYNDGQYNADQFTLYKVLSVLNLFETDYGFDLFNSTINYLEFGVNVELPFPVDQVLDSLVSYNNQPFHLDHDSDTTYYVCSFQRYTVKIYDKGKKWGLSNLLRFEIRARKMAYFNGTGVKLSTLADLLNVANYERLGKLLVNTFNEILFNDLTINPDNLTLDEQEIYWKGCNSRYWTTPNQLISKAAHRQRLCRNKQRYQAFLDQHGSQWPREVAALIAQTWNRLTAINDDLLIQIDNHRKVWKGLALEPDNSTTSGVACHKLTNISPPTCHELTDIQNDDLSQINPLYSGVLCDNGRPDQPPKQKVIFCPITGVTIDQPKPKQRFVSAIMLRSNDDLMLMLDSQHKQYAKGSKEDQYSRAAHNARNKDSNPRNSLRRKINKIYQSPTLFDVTDTLRLTEDECALLDHWKGTKHEVKI